MFTYDEDGFYVGEPKEAAKRDQRMAEFRDHYLQHSPEERASMRKWLGLAASLEEWNTCADQPEGAIVMDDSLCLDIRVGALAGQGWCGVFNALDLFNTIVRADKEQERLQSEGKT